MNNKDEKMTVWYENKNLKCGFTTGSCAAAAAKAAAMMLVTGKNVTTTEIITPAGIKFNAEIEDQSITEQSSACSVKKDGGDDPDVTTGLMIRAEVSFCEKAGIEIDGGAGVGRVTKTGLDQPVGSAAINTVPRKMIKESVENVLETHGYNSKMTGIRVIISVEGGEACAKRTFNPRLGIVGGISILGTSGIVVPMSQKALIDTIRVEIRARVNQGNGFVIAVPGNYGAEYLKKTYDVPKETAVICSNYIGDTIDAALEFGAKGLLLVGHIGKFVKLAAGIMNTHSKEADARMEIIAAHGLRCGASAGQAKALLFSNTTEEAVALLEKYHMTEAVMNSIMKSIEFFLEKRAGENMSIAAVCYSFEKGFLGKTSKADEILEMAKSNTAKEECHL